MTTTEIKKALYKQKPEAELSHIRKGIAYYHVDIETVGNTYKDVRFEIPIEDMGDADFLPLMEAQLLNRWIVNE